MKHGRLDRSQRRLRATEEGICHGHWNTCRRAWALARHRGHRHPPDCGPAQPTRGRRSLAGLPGGHRPVGGGGRAGQPRLAGRAGRAPAGGLVTRADGSGARPCPGRHRRGNRSRCHRQRGPSAAGTRARGLQGDRRRRAADPAAPGPARDPAGGHRRPVRLGRASARIGGDLYEAVSSGGGVRLIVGDVLGKGLPAARTAAVVLGAFRESAYDAASLAEIAARIEASLQHQEAAEEFVTVVLAQVSSDGCRAEILNCGHRRRLRDGEVTAAESAEASLPLRPRGPPPGSTRGKHDSAQARGPAAVLHRRDHRGTRQAGNFLPAGTVRYPARPA